MAMGREGDRQGDLIVTWSEMPRSPGHVFYDRLQEVLIAGGFDRFIETACQAYYAPKLGAPSLPPGGYVLLGSGSGGLTIDAGTAMFLYRALATAEQYVDVALGVRGWGLAGDIFLTQALLPPMSSGLGWADPIIGMRYLRDVGDGYSMSASGDIGGFGLGAHIGSWLVGSTTC
jgi:hypothetical protein